MNAFEKLAMKAVEPYLNKIPNWLDDMAKDFGVEQCYLMVQSKVVDGKKIPVMLVMGSKDGNLFVVKDKEGNKVEYGIQNLFNIGSKTSEDEDEK